MHLVWTCQEMFPPRYCNCAATGLKSLIPFKTEAKEMDTLFKAQTETK